MFVSMNAYYRYLFNCGEGTQRLTSQLSLNKALAQLEHVFITSKSWKNIGGLPGLCLSVRSAGAPDITIHGPKVSLDNDYLFCNINLGVWLEGEEQF